MAPNHERSSTIVLYIKQLRALLWKSWIIRRVHFVSSFFELIGPLILIIAIAILFSTLNVNPGSANSQNEADYKGPNNYTKPYFAINFSNNDELHRVGVQKLVFAPKNDFTINLMSFFDKSFSFDDESALNFEMSKESKDYSTDVVGIYFVDTGVEAIKRYVSF